jgi:polar amino acid transport system substrate-binding protein
MVKYASMTHYFLQLIISFLSIAQPLIAQTSDDFDLPDTVKVGIKPVIPFVIDNDDGVYSGISILFWEKVAEDLGLVYEYQRYDKLESLLDAVAKEEVDLAVGAITITDEREMMMDFTHSYFSSGLGVAVQTNE